MVRNDFPALEQQINGHPLAFLDSAASALKPTAVIEGTAEFYSTDYANVHRGVHTLSQRSTDRYEAVRGKVARFLNAADEREVIFTKGCTEGINLVAQAVIQPGDVVLATTLEHHSNIVPWQLAGAKLVEVPIDDRGVVDLEAYQRLLNDHPVKMVAMIHVSNAIGVVNPVEEMVRMAKAAGALTLVDGAQAGPHRKIDVQAIGCDFYTLSCHKIYAPTGVGVLYGKLKLLQEMPPYQGGGSMIRTVAFEETTFAEVPAKFEPGTPNIAGVVGLGIALDWLASIGGTEAVSQWERELYAYGRPRLADIEGVAIYGQAPEMAGILSFTVKGIHSHDLGTILDQYGVAVRVGHHCCQPLMRRFGIAATARASFAAYTSFEDIDQLLSGLKKAKEFFA